MLSNYFKIAWRNIRKYGFLAFINIFGLAIGILFTLLIAVYIWSELRVNQNLRHAKNQYFLQSEWKDPNLGVDISTVGPLSKRLKEAYPDLVKNYYRWDGITSIVTKGDQHFRENIQLGDSTLLSMYGFPLLHGSVESALTNPYSVVITPEIAVKYFGKTDVVGETISIQSFSGTMHDFLITGVLKAIPENSVTHLNAANNNTFFIPVNTFKFFGRSDFDDWTNIYIPSYVELKEGVSIQALEKAILQLINSNAPDGIKQNLKVKPIALSKYYLQKDNSLVCRMLYTLGLVGLFILLMAVVNFINISISSSSRRMKEIGLRKVIGGLKKQLIIQFLTESILIVFMATVLAIISYPFTKALFEEIVGKRVPELTTFSVYFGLLPVLFILITGITAGLYPAFVLSSLNTIDALKGKLKTIKEKVWQRKAMAAFQFGIAAIVMTMAFIISQQVSYFFSQKLGYNKAYIVTAQVPRDWSKAGVQKMETIRDAFSEMPQVSAVALSYEIPNGNFGGPPVYKAGSDSTQAIAMQAMTIDENYLKTYQIAIHSGSYFDGHGLDSGKVILNEQAVRALGYKNSDAAIGQQVRIPGDPTVFTVKGVAADFHYGSMQQRIAPLIIFNVDIVTAYRYLSFKLKPGTISTAIKNIQNKWAKLLPGSSFEYNFMDDTLKKLYASELQLQKAAHTATLLSLVIVLLGVLGLLSINIQKRTKEIGVRKVLGASVTNIINLFLKDFLPVLCIGGLASIPFAWFIMQDWLNNYAYRINLTVLPFLAALLLLLSITVFVISLQAAKAASDSPVKNLRSE